MLKFATYLPRFRIQCCIPKLLSEEELLFQRSNVSSLTIIAVFTGTALHFL